MLLLLLGIVVLHLSAFALIVVSTVFSAWTAGETYTSDLWTECNSTEEYYTCDSIDAGEWLQALQGLMILSASFSVISFFLFFCQLFTLKKGRRFFLTGIFQIIASLLVLSSAVIYTVMRSEWARKPEEAFGVSYFLAWVAFPLALLSGFIYFILRKKE